MLAQLEAGAAGRGQRAAQRTWGARSGAPPSGWRILTDIVKTANSILEPRKVIELIMSKIQQLIPSEAWSMLMVDEEKQELTFELALGEKGKDVSALRVKMGEGIAGWVAQTGKPTIVNDISKDPRFARRFDNETQFQTRSILCAPLISRGRTIGVVEIINRRGRHVHPGRPGPAADAGRALRDRHRERHPVPAHRAAHHHRRPDQALQLALPEPLHRARDQALQAPRHPALDDLPRPRRLQERQRPARPPGRLAHPDRGGRHPGRRRCARSTSWPATAGDEFVVVLPETPAPGALVIAERIRKRDRRPHASCASQGLEARISASFGIASYPDHALSPEGLIQKADQAMYRVKERDKNGIEVAV